MSISGFAGPFPPGFPPSYLGSKTEVYPFPGNVLMVEECPVDAKTDAHELRRRAGSGT